MYPIIYLKIKKKAKELDSEFPKDFKKILNQYASISRPGNSKIFFTWMFGGNTSTLNAGVISKNKILFNAAWAIRVVFYDNEETLNAFKATIGHELTHQEKEMKVWSANYFTYLFKKRVNEVHADFGAVPKMLNNNRELALKAIEYKDNLKKKEKDSKFSDHPTWEQRYNYIKNYNFNKELIYKIADDMNYHNETIIEMVCEYYEDINLE